MSIRPVKRLIKSKPTLEGAGVRLRRAFGFGDTGDYDPFLLLDDFRGDRPDDYLAGFPWHPHRGIETITYVLAGTVDHGDSLGNRGAIGAGDVQWMTAGRGIVHQEMPHGDEIGRMHGFQLWANLPSSLKMTAPRYQDIRAGDIPEVIEDDGTRVRVVCGNFRGVRGPVDGVAAEPQYLDVWVPAGRRRSLKVDTSRNAFAYVFEGVGRFADASEPQTVQTDVIGQPEGAAAGQGTTAAPGGSSSPRTGDVAAPASDVRPVDADNRSLILFGSGDEITVQAGEHGVRFLFVSGTPIREPVAWRGPIVMNTREELQRAFEEYQNGTFLDPRPR